jgi:hypothetical protein
MLITKFDGGVFANIENSKVIKSVEIRANVPSDLSIEIVKGENGIDLFDIDGYTKANAADRTIKFKVDGDFLKAKLSFSGDGPSGLSWQKVKDSPGGWSISHTNNIDKLEIKMQVSGFGKDSRAKIVDDTGINIDYKDKGKEISLTVVPVDDVASGNLTPGEYRGELIMKLESVD